MKNQLININNFNAIPVVLSRKLFLVHQFQVLNVKAVTELSNYCKNYLIIKIEIESILIFRTVNEISEKIDKD